MYQLTDECICPEICFQTDKDYVRMYVEESVKCLRVWEEIEIEREWRKICMRERERESDSDESVIPKLIRFHRLLTFDYTWKGKDIVVVSLPNFSFFFPEKLLFQQKEGERKAEWVRER